MILANAYLTDLGFYFNAVLVSLTFTSEETLSLTELQQLGYLPVELNNSFVEAPKLDYCKTSGKLRTLTVGTSDDSIIFTITCPTPFRDIDFSSMLDAGFKINTTGETIQPPTIDYLLNR